MGFMKIGTPEKIEVIAKEEVDEALQKFGVIKDEGKEEDDESPTLDPS
jgi:hypothetical protein